MAAEPCPEAPPAAAPPSPTRGSACGPLRYWRSCSPLVSGEKMAVSIVILLPVGGVNTVSTGEW